MREVISQKFDGDIEESIPDELLSILDAEGEQLETFPFTGEAFGQFVDNCATSDLSNKPREVLILVQKAASRAMRKNQRLIDGDILEEIARDGI